MKCAYSKIGINVWSCLDAAVPRRKTARPHVMAGWTVCQILLQTLTMDTVQRRSMDKTSKRVRHADPSVGNKQRRANFSPWKEIPNTIATCYFSFMRMKYSMSSRLIISLFLSVMALKLDRLHGNFICRPSEHSNSNC